MQEVNFILTRFSLLLIVYAISIQILPNSSLPISVFVIGLMSSIYKTNTFNNILRYFIKQGANDERQSLIDSIASFQAYNHRTKYWNNKRRSQFKKLSVKDQKQASAVGYIAKINEIERGINTNSILLNNIANRAIKKYAITPLELRSGTFKENSRVIESLCHFARDWSSFGDKEYEPILQFINSSLSNFAPSNRDKTLVIVPGSGLGKISHYLSTLDPAFSRVESIEFSHLMYLSNEFIFSKPNEVYSLHPFLHNYSNHLNVENQLRKIPIRTVSKSKTLNLNYGDFRAFNIDTSQYDSVIVVTCFFLDTAENLFQYITKIEELIGDKKGLWINVGPLKYGTAPKVELNLNELRELRRLRGWKDLDEPKPYGRDVVGYLTDTDGLWQGYYGLAKWASQLN